MTPTFSVIIPVYNAEAFLERAVRSVQAQTLAPKEILMVDDCSTDGTREAVQRLAKSDPRIRLLQTPRNGGPSVARNLGFDSATADWVAILDADDAFAPSRLERLAETISREPRPDVIADDLMYYDAGAACTTGPANATRGFNGKAITLADFLAHNVVDGKSMDWGLLKPVFRCDFLSETGLHYRTDMRHGEDFAFVISLLLKDAHFILLDEPLYLYTQRSGAISKKLSDLTRTSIAYGSLAASALDLARQPGIAGHAELVHSLQKRAQGLLRLDDAHFFSVAVRRRDVGGLISRVIKRPVFVSHAIECIALAFRRRIPTLPFQPQPSFFSKKTLRLWKDAAKSVLYGIADRKHTAPEFRGWSDTIITNPQAQPTSTIPKIAWFFWDSEEKPPLVQATIDRVQSLNPDHEVRLLDKNTVSQFIDASFLDRSDITLSHKSDIIRLELLAQYGGIWVDATCIFNESFAWVHEANAANSSDLIAFYREQDTRDRLFPIIESWFLACPANNPLMCAWRDEFGKILQLGSKNYFESLRKKTDFDTIRQGIERTEYLVVYLAEQIAARSLPVTRFFLRKAEDGPFLYQQAVKWDRERIATLLCRLDAPSSVPPVIKLTHSNRYLLPLFIGHGLVRKNSILGRFLKPAR